jgi:integrase
VQAPEADRLVFAMPDKPMKLIRTGLDAARGAWIKEARSKEERNERRQSDFLAYRDGAGRVAAFHAPRHTYISRLVASGANIKVAQELARHSTPTLTLGRYAHVQLVDQTRALDALPAIEVPRANDAALAATGTAGSV